MALDFSMPSWIQPGDPSYLVKGLELGHQQRQISDSEQNHRDVLKQQAVENAAANEEWNARVKAATEKAQAIQGWQQYLGGLDRADPDYNTKVSAGLLQYGPMLGMNGTEMGAALRGLVPPKQAQVPTIPVPGRPIPVPATTSPMVDAAMPSWLPKPAPVLNPRLKMPSPAPVQLPVQTGDVLPGTGRVWGGEGWVAPVASGEEAPLGEPPDHVLPKGYNWLPEQVANGRWTWKAVKNVPGAKIPVDVGTEDTPKIIMLDPETAAGILGNMRGPAQTNPVNMAAMKVIQSAKTASAPAPQPENPPAPSEAAKDGGIPKVTSQAEYNALPPGATYIGPIGKATKPAVPPAFAAPRPATPLELKTMQSLARQTLATAPVLRETPKTAPAPQPENPPAPSKAAKIGPIGKATKPAVPPAFAAPWPPTPLELKTMKSLVGDEVDEADWDATLASARKGDRQALEYMQGLLAKARQTLATAPALR